MYIYFKNFQNIHTYVCRAHLFRRLERTKRPFSKSQKLGNVWLGKICGIAFFNQQIFAFQERQFPVAISILRDLQIVISPKIFYWKPKIASGFTVASLVLSLHHIYPQSSASTHQLHTDWFSFQCLCSTLCIVVLHRNSK